MYLPYTLSDSHTYKYIPRYHCRNCSPHSIAINTPRERYGPLFDQKEGIIAQLILLFVGIVFYSGSLFLTTNLGARNLKKKL